MLLPNFLSPDVLWQETEVNIPRSWLSGDIKEGDHFAFSFQKIDQSTVSHDVGAVLERLENDPAVDFSGEALSPERCRMLAESARQLSEEVMACYDGDTLSLDPFEQAMVPAT